MDKKISIHQPMKAALEYVKLGWHVLPLHTPNVRGICDCGKNTCPSPGKHPRTAHGVKDATNDEGAVRKWWGRWPRANVGLATGKASGFFVLDVDGKKGEKFLEKNGVPDTARSKTFKGSHHLFQHPGFVVTNLVRKVAADLDVRGDGGYIVAPPSIHAEGSRYSWVGGKIPKKNQVAQAPDWLLKILDPAGRDHMGGAAGVGSVRKGGRNSHLMSVAGRLRKQGLSEEAIFAALRQENSEKCQPALDEEEVKKIAESAARYEPQPKEATESTKALKLLSGAELFHFGDQGFATVPVEGHQETWLIRGSMFKRWLQRRFFEVERRTLSSTSLQDALDTLEAKAMYEGPESRVWLRVAGVGGKVYIDMCDEAWRVIEVSKTGWKIVTDAPVKFRRTRGMLPLPVPVQQGKVSDLRRFINLAGDEEMLLWAWLVAALYPKGPYSILVLRGEQGSAKSTVARVIRSLIDPNICPLRSASRDERDLMIAASNGWLICLDNLSSLGDWLSDALCRVSTGAGLSTRQLHSDDEEKLFDVQRPVSLNGIEDFATRGDILDRALVLQLPAIPKKKRKSESLFWAEFDRAKPSILGGLLTVLSKALSELPNVKIPYLPRMADFATLATAAEKAFEWPEGGFMRAYEAHARDANSTVLESMPVAGPLVKMMKGRGAWSGTVTDLLTQLLQSEGHHNFRPKGWPASGQGLSNALRRIEPHLRMVGVTLEFIKTRTNRVVNLKYVAQEASSVSTASTSGGGPAGDTVDTVVTSTRDNRPAVRLTPEQRRRMMEIWNKAKPI